MGVDVASLLMPISDGQPTGINLREDDDGAALYYRLKDARATARVAERQADVEAERRPLATEWRVIYDSAQQLLRERTKDLEIAVWLTEAALRLDGFAGLQQAFGVLDGLVARYWSALHSLDAEDLSAKVAPLAGLNGVGADGALIQPMRLAPITNPRTSPPAGLWDYVLMRRRGPGKRPTAGIAMGLILEGERFAVLSDILGDEDHLGDMDFKVAGTEEGITSLQMDIKIAGITEEIMQVALGQAKDGRIHILGEMSKALTGARAELGEFAPRIETLKIPTDKIREVIGTGGKVIREIVEKTGAKVNIEDDGTVKVASSDGNSIKAAIAWIKSIATDPEVGMIYEGTVVKCVDFGAFVNFYGSKDGLVHISQLAKGRVNKTQDVVSEGQKVKVKLMGFDDRGKVRLSMRVVDQETGEDLEGKEQAAE